MRVTVIGRTDYREEVAAYVASGFVTDGNPGERLVEFSGRACYQSFNKPNPATATNAKYIEHIREVGHYSVLEHGIVSMYIEGVSRSLTHELVRHRHFSFSQLSQRFFDEEDFNFVRPPALMPLWKEPFREHYEREYGEDLDGYSIATIGDLLENFLHNVSDLYVDLVKALVNRGLSRKQAREAARCILPNGTETKIVVTGNYRAWRKFLALRGTIHADAEIRELALKCHELLMREAPSVFEDFTTHEYEGKTLLTSAYFDEG